MELPLGQRCIGRTWPTSGMPRLSLGEVLEEVLLDQNAEDAYQWSDFQPALDDSGGRWALNFLPAGAGAEAGMERHWLLIKIASRSC